MVMNLTHIIESHCNRLNANVYLVILALYFFILVQIPFCTNMKMLLYTQTSLTALVSIY